MNNLALQVPVIIIGMHRSGTTLLCQCLEQAGIFMGVTKDENQEALFFFRLNEWMFRQSDASWDHPKPMMYVNEMLADRYAWVARRRIRSPFFSEFTGLARYVSGNIPWEAKCSWGWKDPRNSYTLPIWKSIFPGAKVLHIYRNPIDVALSLSARAKSYSYAPSRTDFFKELFLKGRIRYHESNRIKDVREGIALWAEYVSTCLNTGPNTFHIKYETLLSNPIDSLTSVLQFLHGSQPTGELYAALRRIACGIRKERQFAFMSSEIGRDLYREYSSLPLLKSLGYHDIDNI